MLSGYPSLSHKSTTTTSYAFRVYNDAIHRFYYVLIYWQNVTYMYQHQYITCIAASVLLHMLFISGLDGKLPDFASRTSPANFEIGQIAQLGSVA